MFLLALLLVPSPATAHSDLASTDPEDGARLETLPTVATVTLSDEAKQADAVLAMPNGTVRTLEPQIIDSVLKVPLPTEGPRGDYKLSYRVVSADGHPVSGSVRFTVTTGPAPNAAPTQSPQDSSASGESARGLLGPIVIVVASLGMFGMMLAARSLRR